MLNNISRKASCLVFLLVLMLAAGALCAQVAQPDNNVEQAGVQLTSTVTASATAERVRFTSPNTVVQLRLEVYDEAGQKLLDTEQRGGNVLDWHLQGGAGERVADGVYLCVLTIKNLAGRLNQKLGLVTVNAQSTVVRSAAVAELNLRQAQTVGPIESGDAGLTVMGSDDAPVTVLANNGNEAQLARTRGALTFRVGDFFSGADKEQMRLTEEGNLGIGTKKPQAKLDVAGTIRAREGFMFSDGSTLKLNEKGVLTRTSADGLAPSVVTTQNKLAKFTDNAGTVGDSIVTESAGNIGIGTTPTQALDVANGRIVTTGSKSLTSTSDSMLEVKTTITNNGLAQSAIKARNIFNGSGDYVTGSDIAPTFAPSQSINTAQGFVAAGFFAPPPGVTITNAIGGASATVYSNVSGAVTNGIAFNLVSPFVSGALKPTTQYGLRINNQGIGGTTNSYGLYVDAQSGSLNNYSAIFAGGNVGIGTPSPQQNLSVNGAMNVDQANLNGGSFNPGITFGSGSGEGIASNRSGSGNQFGLDFYTFFLNRMSITNGGNVGIGTTTPGAPLDVQVAAGQSLQFRQDSGLVPGINVKTTGGLAGIMRLRNSVEVWPSDDATRAGKVDVRDTSGFPTITLDGQTGDASFRNMPGIQYSQGPNANTRIDGGNSATVDSLTINAPASGFIFVSADVEAYTEHGGNHVFDFTLSNFGTFVVNSKSETRTNTSNLSTIDGEVPIHLSWVFPVNAGSLQLRTSLYYDNFCACGASATLKSHNLTAIYLPKQY